MAEHTAQTAARCRQHTNPRRGCVPAVRDDVIFHVETINRRLKRKGITQKSPSVTPVQSPARSPAPTVATAAAATTAPSTSVAAASRVPTIRTSESPKAEGYKRREEPSPDAKRAIEREMNRG